MDKRERVIKGLERHFIIDMEPCEKCPYYGDINCTDTMAKDALELLKAQEPIEPKVGHNIGPTWWYACSACNGAIDQNDKYCRHCGKELKWR